jgi:hypothetical protein
MPSEFDEFSDPEQYEELATQFQELGEYQIAGLPGDRRIVSTTIPGGQSVPPSQVRVRVRRWLLDQIPVPVQQYEFERVEDLVINKLMAGQ